MKKRAPTTKPAKTECQPTCPAPRATRTRQKCSQNDHFRTQKSSSKAVRMCVDDVLSRWHKSDTRTLPPPSNWCGTPPTPKHSTNGLRGRDSDFWVWGGGSLLAARARDADAARTPAAKPSKTACLLTCESPRLAQTDEKSHPSCQTLQNRVLPNLRISPTCPNS